MTAPCPRGLDANDVANALHEETRSDFPDFPDHLNTCSMCQQNARVIQSAHRTWRAAALLDDVRQRNASERRLVQSWRTPRPAFGWRSALVGAAIAAVLMLRFGPRWPDAHDATNATNAAHETATTASFMPPPAAVPSASVTGPVVTPSPARTPSIVVMRDCPACARSGMTANSTLDAAAEVPRGASLMLSWSMPDEGESASSLEITGPARVAPKATREGAAPALQIERGRAEVHTFGESDVQSPHATMHTLPKIASAWHFEVGPTRTSIVVDAGWVAVGAIERKAPSIHLVAGQSAEVRSGGEIVLSPRSTAPEAPSARPPKTENTPSPPPPATAQTPSIAPAPSATVTVEETDATLWQAVQTALHAGDRAVAETKARALMLSGRSPNYREKAAFVVGELELSRGDVSVAQGRLTSLAATANDPALAADATFLLARSYSAPQERAKVWARFLASGPSSPYREQAMLERGRALADAGDIAGARQIVDALKQVNHLPEIVARGLSALDARTRR